MLYFYMQRKNLVLTLNSKYPDFCIRNRDLGGEKNTSMQQKFRTISQNENTSDYIKHFVNGAHMIRMKSKSENQ